jgi:phosphoribosyl-ATP pyrophosphohydrolase/phosphoribosyl-AMP cyclohydrolase
MNANEITYGEDGLVPVIVQDAGNGQVLMFAYANREAVEKMMETGKTHFWSRSRKKLWQKGEESGNVQEVKRVILDCDGDCLLVTVEQKGVACHTGERTCFFRGLGSGRNEAPAFGGESRGRTFDQVYEVITDRRRNPREDSYVSSLFRKGLDKVLEKIIEEAGEMVIASKNQKKEDIIYEATDLFFHVLVALSYFDVKPGDIYAELARRFGKKGSEYRQNG